MRWFSQVQRRVIIALVRKNEFIQVEEKKISGRPKITSVEVVKRTCQLRK